MNLFVLNLIEISDKQKRPSSCKGRRARKRLSWYHLDSPEPRGIQPFRVL